MFRGSSRQEGMKTLTLFTTLLVTSSFAAADTALPEPVAKLHAFAGSWKATGTITMGADTVKVTGSYTCKPVSGKLGILCTVKVVGIPGVATYEETDLFGYEPNSNAYHWFSVTAAGETHDHVAKPFDGNKIQFVYAGTQDGKPMKEVCDLELTGKKLDAMTVRSETFVGGTSMVKMEVKLRK
jgi:hypothetical protein